ncbi:PQQ-binding-like beta-propeller repeat protein [Halorussus gelatinilyticus]|uniref:PQQ-binding-like beta-propeller repeat protein n=1 Tax=Halorussus gelatinilyticus TaxID=2937524 RepID=A0A8U0IPQ8_9EURY|nr:PQQ-binding-like beta-propeller repeat protein [Halorussus gelatinilyticus]UPW02124.1 PQQ-binding-like beta-propeller repeat protein [Halorussus gelatinilyticus]
MRRRALLATCGAALSAGCAGWGPLGGPTGSGCELADGVPGDAAWTSARGGPRNTASSPADRTPAPPFSISWTFSIPGVTGTPVPTPAEGTVFTSDLDSGIFAIDAETGAERWRASVSDPGAVAVADGTAFVAGEEGVLGFDAATGEKRWRAAVATTYDGSPVVADGTVYVPAGLSLVALDAATGAERWRYTTGLSTEAPPAVGDGTVFLGDGDAYVYALDAATGAEQWRFKTGGRVECAPALAGETVYAGSRDGRVHALDAAAGRRRWSYATDRGVESLTVGHGIVYAGTRERLHAVRRESGARCWRSDRYVSQYSGGPAVGGGYVFASTDGGTGRRDFTDTRIGAFEAGTGELVWQFGPVDRQVDLGPAIADGALFSAGGGAGSLAVVRLDPKSG